MRTPYDIFLAHFDMKKGLQLRTKYMKQSENQENRTGTENFDIIFCVIFYSYHQSFQMLPKFLNSSVLSESASRKATRIQCFF